MTRTLTDRAALDAIARQLDGREWDGSDIETVAELVRETGRTVGPPRGDTVRRAVRTALRYCRADGMAVSVAGIADCAWDQLDTTCSLTGEQETALQADIVADVLAVLGLDGGASDATLVTPNEMTAAERRLG